MEIWDGNELLLLGLLSLILGLNLVDGSFSEERFMDIAVFALMV